MVITSVSIVCEEKNVGEKFTLIQYNSFDVHRYLNLTVKLYSHRPPSFENIHLTVFGLYIHNG